MDNLRDVICRDLEMDVMPEQLRVDIDLFLDAIYDIYKQMFEVENYDEMYFVRAKKTSYIDWPEYFAIERHIKVRLKPKNQRNIQPNKIRWKAALLNLFCQHTKCLRQKWRNFQIKLKEQEEQQRLMDIENTERRRIEHEKWKAEHEIKMKTDPVYVEEYRKQQLHNIALQHNILRIMSGCSTMAYSN